MNDDIGKALGLAPIEQQVLIPSSPARSEQMETDFDYARGNLINIIEKGNEALSGILDVAGMSQHPRSYEVVATLIKTMSDVNKDLIELNKKKMDMTGESPSTKTINNNLFVGSTAELQKFLKINNGEQ